MSETRDVKDTPTVAEAEEKPGQKPKRTPPQDAFSELMARKKAKPETSTSASASASTSTPHKPHMMHHPRPQGGFGGNARWRAGGSLSSGHSPAQKYQGPEALGAYMADPEGPANRDAVVFFDDSFVAVHDKFPKAIVHCLLLPRSFGISKEHPLELFSRTDPESLAFLESVRKEAAKLAKIVAADLQRRFGQYSAADAARQAALRGDDLHDIKESKESESTLPAGRDWLQEVLVGVHARPSMAHLHVHVLSRDMHSDKMRHRKHYNSFATPFFVGLDAFPLPREDARLASLSDAPLYIDHIKDDLKCWRCGRNFGNKFAELKRHLDVEFEAWKKE